MDLRREIRSNGVDMLREVKAPRYKGQDIQLSCCFHKDGRESHPSAGIVTMDKVGKSGKKLQAGLFSCFACKKTVDFTDFVSHCLGYDNDMGTHGAKWILDNYGEYILDHRVFPSMSRGEQKKEEIVYITEEELSKYRFYHDYMYKRKLTDKVIDLFDVGYDSEFTLVEGGNKIPCITFPVRDAEGNCLFVARRAIRQKLFSYPADVMKPIYGIYELGNSYEDVYITESIINCLTLWSYGFKAVALNGTGNELQYDMLKNMTNRHFILALDNDNAGITGRNKLRKSLSSCKLLTYIEIEELNTDINDISKEEFLKLEEMHF